MKRTSLLVLTVMMMLSAFGRITSEPQPAKNYAGVIKSLGLSCPDFISFKELVGDTIYLRTYKGQDGDNFFGLEYVVPDTIWVKHKKKNPVEGKHYYLLHCFGAKYELDGKNVYLYDYTTYYQVGEENNGVAFRIDNYVGDSVFYATEIKSQRQITFNPNKLNNLLYIKSSKYDRYYRRLLRTSYYTYQKLNAFSKKYSQHTIGEITPFFDYRGRLLLNTDIYTQQPFATREQYVGDSIAEAKYWEEFNRPHVLNYFVNKQAKILDAPIRAQFGKDVTALLQCRRTSIGQTVAAGNIKDDANLAGTERINFVGIDSICGKEFFIAGYNGAFFYIDPADVIVDWEEVDDEGARRDHTYNSQIIKVYRSLLPEDKRAYSEYMKSYVYDFSEEYKASLLKPIKQASAKGLIITDMSLTEDYYSTGLNFSLINKSKRTIKYIALTTKGLNAVKDPIESKTARGIGPIEPEEAATYEFENIWWTDLVEFHKPVSLVITYMDGSTKTLNAKDIESCWLDDVGEIYELLENATAPEGLKRGFYDPTTGRKEEYGE